MQIESDHFRLLSFSQLLPLAFSDAEPLASSLRIQACQEILAFLAAGCVMTVKWGSHQEVLISMPT